MKKVLVFGATATLVQSTLRCFAARGDALYLVGRNAEKLAFIADDLRTRNAASVTTRSQDLIDPSAHAALVDEAIQILGGLDVALIAHGTLGDGDAWQRDAEHAEHLLRVNLLSVVSLLTPIANRCEAQGRGVIAVVTSVAGDRGRRSNYVYGASKGALSIYLEGLGARLHRSGVRVVTIKPGWVASPMTAGRPIAPLAASANKVGKRIFRAINRDSGVVYVPRIWRWTMLAVKLIPEPVFKRLSFF